MQELFRKKKGKPLIGKKPLSTTSRDSSREQSHPEQDDYSKRKGKKSWAKKKMKKVFRFRFSVFSAEKQELRGFSGQCTINR
jgi:hypothetical protein